MTGLTTRLPTHFEEPMDKEIRDSWIVLGAFLLGIVALAALKALG